MAAFFTNPPEGAGMVQNSSNEKYDNTYFKNFWKLATFMLGPNLLVFKSFGSKYLVRFLILWVLDQALWLIYNYNDLLLKEKVFFDTFLEK